jgi:nicotinate-nucleotide adenylyltransferase
MAMCELAFALFRSVQILDVERQLGGVSRTLRTLETLRTEHSDVQFRLLIGADVLPTTDRWHHWNEIVRIAPALVVGRDGYPLPEGCPISIPDVSSTEIRAAFDSGEDLTGLLPTPVLEYIQAHGLYSGDE